MCLGGPHMSVCSGTRWILEVARSTGARFFPPGHLWRRASTGNRSDLVPLLVVRQPQSSRACGGAFGGETTVRNRLVVEFDRKITINGGGPPVLLPSLCEAESNDSIGAVT
jgi:hypothetical protein